MTPEDLISDSGALLRVCGERGPIDVYSVVELVFEHGTLRLSCNPDTDEVLVAASRAEPATEDLSTDASFRPLIGKAIEQAWSMTNHRGYTDAFQLRLLDLSDRSEATRQFEVAASAMHVCAVTG